jgi:hypothetical protein
MNIGNATTIVSKILANGGISIDNKGHELSDCGGYAVSIFPDRGTQVNSDEFGPDDILAFSRKNADILDKKGAILGAWRDNGKVYLDVSIFVENRDRALFLAKQHAQLAIYDFTARDSVYL